MAVFFNPFMHDQPFANQLGKREKLACFRAKLASCPIASSPSNRHSCFCYRAKPARYCAKQPVIISISQAGPAASIPNSSSFRALFELIMSLLRAYYELFPWTAKRHFAPRPKPANSTNPKRLSCSRSRRKVGSETFSAIPPIIYFKESAPCN